MESSTWSVALRKGTLKKINVHQLGSVHCESSHLPYKQALRRFGVKVTQNYKRAC